MANGSFIVQGSKPLSGSIVANGNKNEALPVLAACLLTSETVTLHNVPLIGDIRVMAELLEALGAKIEKDENDPHTWRVTSENILSSDIPENYFTKIRASICLAAPLLHRCGKLRLPLPGGDQIGARSITTHLLGLQTLGVTIYDDEKGLLLINRSGLQGQDMLLDEASVTGTENLIMAAVLASGETVIYNAACEPHVQQLCLMLNKMGANISGIGSNRLIIQGVTELKGCEHTIDTDYIEVASFIALAAATKNAITIGKGNCAAIPVLAKAFAKLGVRFDVKGADIFVPAKQEMEIHPGFRDMITKLESAIWPGVPADILSLLLTVATQCKGTVLIHEKMFESRLFFIDRLISMGARIVLCDPHRAVVIGPAQLRGEKITSPDIRAGVSLLIAALCAKGKSRIDNIYMIDRGYEKIDERLRSLGADIERIEET